ncbi:MAG: hypothetical protein FWB82_01415 [Treponema sp.]|nr:hypothetical protein [Treponema sp.]
MPRCGLLGRKLVYSYSPAIHKAFDCGYDYELFEVEPEDLASFFAGRDLHGFNVTNPYKQDALAFCDELSPAARLIGSVNTVIRKQDGGYYGDNTDIEGFRKMLLLSGIEVKGKKAIVFGKGGSSLSVCRVLKNFGSTEIITLSSKDNNHDFLSRHSDAAVLINCTPVGTYPETEKTPAPLDYFPHLEGVLDLTYNPARTHLMMDSAERGVRNTGGLSMLVGQAAAAAKIFSGREVDEGKEREVLKMLSLRMENIVLIGMPGCGKTTIGRLLSEISGKPLIDIDSQIEVAAGKTIPEIFASEGEAAFRRIEADVIKKYGKESGLILATGGGCVTQEENYRRLRQNASVVFITRSIEKLARDGRPLSQGNLSNLYEDRLPLYRRFADITVANDSDAQTAAMKILTSIEAAGEA